MKKIGDSWRHHAFPFALQRYWKTAENICWIDNAGNTIRRPFGRKATGWLPNGHSVVLDQPWGTGPNAIHGFNFEAEFEYIDNLIPEIVESLIGRQPKRFKLFDALRIFQAVVKNKGQTLRIGDDFFLTEDEHRKIVELLFSIVNRSLMQRRIFENFSVFADPISRRTVGTSNLNTAFKRDQGIARNGPIVKQHLLALYDPNGGFVFPDGLPNWIVMRANDHRIRGRLFVPLTPNLVMYLSTPEVHDARRSLSCFLATTSLRNQINEVLMSFSETKTYFQGDRPKEAAAFPRTQAQYFDPNFHPLFRLLDIISGYQEPASILDMRKALSDYFLDLGKSESAGGEIILPPGFLKNSELGSNRDNKISKENGF